MSPVAPSSILVRVPNWIGDAVMCEPAVRDLAERFPSSKISILSRPGVTQLFGCHPAVTDAIAYDWKGEHRGWAGKWRLARDLKRKNFDMAVLFQNAFEAAWIAWQAHIPQRVGYATDGRRPLLTHPIAVSPPSALHHMQYYQRMIARAFAQEAKPRVPVLYMNPEEKARIKTKFPELDPFLDSCLVGINPGSVYGSAKRWPADRFAVLADRLSDELTESVGGGKAVTCVIVGGTGEEELGQAIAEKTRCKAVVLSGRTTIRELMAILQRCVILVTNDTGPMHMAQALGVPVVGIFGPTNPDSTGPVNQEHAMVRSAVRCAPCLLRACPIDHRCMTGISVEQVLRTALSQVMNASPALPISCGGGARSDCEEMA